MGALALIAILLSAGPNPAESSVSFDGAAAAFVAERDFVVLTAGATVALHVQDAAAGDALFFDLVRMGPMGAPGPLTLHVRFGDQGADVAALTVKTPVRIERKVAAGPGGGEWYASNPARHRVALPRGNTEVVLVADGDGAVRVRIGRSRARARAAGSLATRAGPPVEDASAPEAQPTATAAAAEQTGASAAVAGAQTPSLPLATSPAATPTSAMPPPGAPTDRDAPAPADLPAVSPRSPDATAEVEPLAQEPPPGQSAAVAPAVDEGAVDEGPSANAVPPAVVAPTVDAPPARAIAVSGDVRIGVRGLWSGLQPVAPMGVARVFIGSRNIAAGLAVDFDLSHADVETPQASWDAASTQVRVEARLQSPTAFQVGTVALTPALVVGLGGRAVAHSIVTALPSARALHVWQLGAAGRMEAEVSTHLGPGDVVVSLPVDVAADPFGPVAGFVPLAVGILVGYRLAP